MLSDKGKECNLSDVLYVPNLSYNLLSVSKSTDTIKSTVFTSKVCDFLNAEGKVVATGKRIGELYYLNCSSSKAQWCRLYMCINKILLPVPSPTAKPPHMTWWTALGLSKYRLLIVSTT